MLRKMTLLFVVMMMVSVVASAQVVTLSVDDLGPFEPGDTIAVPIQVSDLTGMEILGFQFYLCYASTALDFDSVEWGNVLPDGWDIYATLDSPGVLNLFGFDNDAPLEGTGLIATAYFRVREEADCVDPYLFYFDQRPCCLPVFGNGDIVYDVVTNEGSFYVPCPSSLLLKGFVNTWSCGESPLKGMVVDLHDMGECSDCEPTESTWLESYVTTDDGEYEFSILSTSNYCVVVNPPCIQADELDSPEHADINNGDADALVEFLGDWDHLQYCAIAPGTWGDDPYTTMYPMMEAADLTYDRMINVIDASVLKQVIFKICGFGNFAGEVCWIPVTTTARQMLLTVPAPGEAVPDTTILDFVFLLTGDINGSYGSTGRGETVKSLSTIEAPFIGNVIDSTIGTITLQNASDFSSSQFVLNYDPSEIMLSGFSLSDDLEGCDLDYMSEPGRVMFLILTPGQDYSTDSLDLIQFTATMLNENAESHLTIEHAMVNDGIPSVRNGLISTDSIVGNEDMTWGKLKTNYR